MLRTLGDQLAGRDGERFVGRAAELRVFDSYLESEAPGGVVVLVHGPGGIGKSTLLREVARRGAALGWTPWPIDGRELAPTPGALEGALAGAREEPRPLILVDTYERMAALDGLVRRDLLPSLPARALVVLAGRGEPAADWLEGGWEHLVRTVALAPLSAADSLALVTARGVADADTATALVRWAAGSPLALALAADAAVRDGTFDELRTGADPELVGTLVRRLGLAPQRSDHADVAAVASVARVTTAALLAEVLPGIDPHAAHAWLRAQPGIEPVGDGLAMHDVVRRALRAHLRAERPDHERELRRRVADHLLGRALEGELRLTGDLADLVEDPALRWAFGAEAAAGLRADELHRGELDAPAPEVRARASEAWWTATRPLLRHPEHVVVARDRDDALCGMAITFTPANASRAALADPYSGDWIRHAAAHVPDGNAIVWRDVLDLTSPERGDIGSRVASVLNTAALLRSGLPNPRCIYVPISAVNEASVEFARQSGSRRIPGLDVEVSGHLHECHVIDHGPEGILGAMRSTIYAEVGLARPQGAPARPPGASGVTREDIRQALRDLDRPSRLAVNPLASVMPGRQPAVAVRAALATAVTGAFGAGSEEALLRDIVDRAYVHPSGAGHEAAARSLHVSRATYFRRLGQASDRIADHVLAGLVARGA
ncbi:MAG TPA: ATP-binding protein [Solirubrobacteraceae bacterium]